MSNPDRAVSPSVLIVDDHELFSASVEMTLCNRGIHAVRAHSLEPSAVLDQATQLQPSLILLESRRGGKPGLAIEPALFLRGEDGEESAELKRIYRKE